MIISKLEGHMSEYGLFHPPILSQWLLAALITGTIIMPPKMMGYRSYSLVETWCKSYVSDCFCVKMIEIYTLLGSRDKVIWMTFVLSNPILSYHTTE